VAHTLPHTPPPAHLGPPKSRTLPSPAHALCTAQRRCTGTATGDVAGGAAGERWPGPPLRPGCVPGPHMHAAGHTAAATSGASAAGAVPAPTSAQHVPGTAHGHQGHGSCEQTADSTPLIFHTDHQHGVRALPSPPPLPAEALSFPLVTLVVVSYYPTALPVVHGGAKA